MSKIDQEEAQTSLELPPDGGPDAQPGYLAMLTLNDLFQGFRQPEVIRALAAQITELAKDLPEPLRVMEVCGGHTHTIMKYGLHQLLPASIEFVHGPGCPVCIMPKERIDQAIELANQPSVILVTLGI